MQVILVKPVRKLGKVGETVNVANGYGRNYLVPQGYAIRATKDNVAKFDSLKKELESKNEEVKKSAEKAAKAIDGKHLTFVTQSAADGRLFGSVSAKALAVELSKMAGIELNYYSIILESPIKFNGVYEVEVVLHPEIVKNILIVVAKTEAEAQDALKEYKEGGKKDEEAERLKQLEMEAISAAAAMEAHKKAEASEESADNPEEATKEENYKA